MSLQGVRFRLLATSGQPYAPTRSLDPGQTAPWRRLVNLRYHDGHLEWRAALRRLLPTGSLSTPPFDYSEQDRYVPILHIFQAWTGYADPSGKQWIGTIIVTGADIYSWDGQVWRVLTPTYSTGTITATSGVTTITGVGTLWQTMFMAPGYQIFVNGSGWHNIVSVNGEGNVTVSPAPTANHSGTYTIRRCMNLSAILSTDWLTDYKNVFAVMHNGDLYVAGSRAGGQCQAVIRVSDPFSASFATTYLTATLDLTGSLDTLPHAGITGAALFGLDVLPDGRVVIANQEDGQRVSRLRFSSPTDQTLWTTSPGGFVDVVSGGIGAITSFVRFGENSWAIHYADGIALAVLTGLTDRPLEMRTTRATSGAVFPRTVVNAGGMQFFMGSFGAIKSFDGSVVRTVSNEAHDDSVDWTAQTPRWAPHGTYDEHRDEIRFYVTPNTGAVQISCVVFSVADGRTRIEQMRVPVLASYSSPLNVPGDTGLGYIESKSRGALLWGSLHNAGATATDQGLGHVVERWGEDESTILGIDTGLAESAWADTDYISPQGLATVPHEVQIRVKKPAGSLSAATSDQIEVGFSSNGGLSYAAGFVKTKTVTYSAAGESQLLRFYGFSQFGAESWRMRIRVTTGLDKFVGAIEAIEVLMSPIGAIGATP